MAANDYRVGECDTCQTRCENLTWGEEFPTRLCRECYKKENLCDWCLKKQDRLYEQVDKFNPIYTHRYCRDCDQMLKEDDLAMKSGMWISRHGPYESRMRRWWSMHEQKEIRARMTPEVIERVEDDIAKHLLRKA